MLKCIQYVDARVYLSNAQIIECQSMLILWKGLMQHHLVSPLYNKMSALHFMETT